jgi:hypothetical protein
MNFERITANVAGSVRRDRMEGRDYLVVPMIMMCEGVHNGSNGPLYYPAPEMARMPAVWNHKPIVIYHPTRNGTAASACDPDVISSRKVGVVMNNVFIENKWRAEAWLEEDRLRAVDPRVLTMIENNEMSEVSTGLFTENEATPGTWNGEEYVAIARNYGPDHLAILPDIKGACSIEDGAGLLRANAEPVVENRYFSAKERRGMDLADFGDPDRRAYPVRDQADLENAARLIGHAADPEAVKRRLLAIAKRKGLKVPAAWRTVQNAALAHNAMSYGNVAEALRAKLRDTVAGDGPYSCWVVDVYPNFFIYEEGSDLYRATYKEDKGDVTITGDPEPVVRYTEYRTLEGAYVGNSAWQTTPTEVTMDKKQTVDGLIANGGWAESDREWLMGLTDARLALVGKPAAPAANQQQPPTPPPAAPVVNNTPPAVPAAPVAPAITQAAVLQALQGLTPEQYVAFAPPGIRDAVIDGMNAVANERTALIKEIVTNQNNTFSEAMLQQKPTSELRGMVALARGTGPALPEGFRLPNYGGAAGGPPAVNAAELPVLDLPIMNFEPAK